MGYMTEGPKYTPKQRRKTNQNKARFYSIYVTVDTLPCWRGGANKLTCLRAWDGQTCRVYV